MRGVLHVCVLLLVSTSALALVLVRARVLARGGVGTRRNHSHDAVSATPSLPVSPADGLAADHASGVAAGTRGGPRDGYSRRPAAAATAGGGSHSCYSRYSRRRQQELRLWRLGRSHRVGCSSRRRRGWQPYAQVCSRRRQQQLQPDHQHHGYYSQRGGAAAGGCGHGCCGRGGPAPRVPGPHGRLLRCACMRVKRILRDLLRFNGVSFA